MWPTARITQQPVKRGPSQLKPQESRDKAKKCRKSNLKPKTGKLIRIDENQATSQQSVQKRVEQKQTRNNITENKAKKAFKTNKKAKKSC